MRDLAAEPDAILVEEIARAWTTGSLGIVLGPEFDRDNDDAVRHALLRELGDDDRTAGSSVWRLADLYSARFGRTALVSRMREAARRPTEDGAGQPDAASQLYAALAAHPPASLLVTSLQPHAERAFRRFRRPFHVVKTETAIAFWDTAQPQIVHLYGSLDAPQDALVTERERRGARFRRPLLTARIADLPASHTLIFVGFAAHDPALDDVLGAAAHSLGDLWRGATVVLRDADSGLRSAYGENRVRVIDTGGTSSAQYAAELFGHVRRAAERHTPEVLRADTPLIRDCEKQLRVLGWSIESSVRLSDRAVESVFRHRDNPGMLTAHIVEGELSGSDVQRLSERLPDRGHGMAVTETRISNTARHLAKADERIEVHTRSSMLDLVLGVEGYLRWILDDYASGNQQDEYVDLQCQRPLSDMVAAIRGDAYWLDDYVDSWLREQSQSQLILLGEPGSGKSWYCRHLTYALGRRCLDDPERGRIPVLALLSELPATGSMTDFLVEQMRSKGAELRAGAESFRYANETGRLVIVLDGLDELRWQVSPERARQALSELAELTGPHSKLLIASRPGYFEQDRSILRPGEAALTIEDSGSAAVGVDGTGRMTFDVIRLADLGYEQRVQALVRRLGTGADPVRQVIDASSALTDLARLPGLLDLMSVVLSTPGLGTPATASELFERYVVALLGGGEVAADGIDTIHADVDRLATVAGLMHSQATHLLGMAEVRRIVGIEPDSGPVLPGRLGTDPRWESFLRVAPDGSVRFRLKTMRECLTARSICTALRAGESTALDERLLLPETLGYLAEQLFAAGLSPLDWLPGPTPAEDDPDQQAVGQLNGGRLAANCVSLANRLGNSLAGRSLRGLDLRGADLRGADLRGADLSDCDLRTVLLQGAIVAGADLRRARLHGAILHETQVVAVVRILPGDGGVVAGTADGLVHLLTSTDLSTVRTMRCPGGFRSLLLLGHGRYVVVAGLDGSINLADRETAQAFLEIAHHGAPANSAAVVDDTSFASGGTDGVVRMWTIDGEELWHAHTTAGYVRALALDPLAGRLYAGSSDGSVAVLDVTTGDRLHDWQAHPGGGVYCLCVLAAGGLVATGSDDRSIRLFEPDGTHAGNFATVRDTVLAMAHDPSADVLFVGCRDGSVSCRDLSRQDLIWSVSHHEPVLSIAFDSRSQVLAAGSADGWVRLYDGRSGRVLGERLVGERSESQWSGVDLRGTTGWNKEWLRFMGERGAILDD